jgi:tetratricopeptide (TPR) repeat protein
LDAGGDLIALAVQERVVRVRASVPFDATGEGTEDMHRRHLINAAATLAIGVAGLAGIDLDPGSRRRIGHAEVDRIEQNLNRMYVIDSGHGAGDLWDIAVARAQSVSLALELCDYDEEVGRRLLAVAGYAYVGAGWFALDAGRDEVARNCYNEAVSLARQAGDGTLTGTSLSNLALQAVRLRQPRQALRYLTAAQHALPRDAPTRQAAALRMRRGRALAQLGEATGASRELTAARRMLARDHGTVPERMAFLTEAEIDAQAAMAALDLGRHTQAARLLEQAIAAYDPRFTRNLVLYQAWLAGARAGAHHLDGAAESINHTLDALTTHVTSRRATTILNKVITTHHLADHRDVPAVASALTRCEALQRG